MPRGGARTTSGPAPRVDSVGGWTDLPAEGRQGEPPSWPLSRANAREKVVWAAVWVTPQAVAWERLVWLMDVALYVRLMVLAERGDLKAATEARQWSDRLGLNPAAMMRNRWRTATDQVAEQRSVASPAVASPRSRLRVADVAGA